MVRVDRITMRGFKSFSDRTTIPFPSGFTTIAGPNGSGKSNIVDAITFVLGVSSAKAIRANRLINLIFNGGKSRKPSDHAEVSLYIDNKDKKVALDEEIKITRKVNRRGLSIYKINERTVTRRRFLEILTALGLSPEGYNIIMQGDVTKIIEMNPEERRQIIDDISGISEFEEKKQKAQKELEKVETRVREMYIVVNEKLKLRARLEEEKKNAERYLTMQKKLKKLKASLVKRKFDDLKYKWKEMSMSIEKNEKKLKETSKALSLIDKELSENESLISKTRREVIEKSKDFSLTKEIDKIKTELLRKKDKIEFNERDVARLNSIIEKSEQTKNKAVKEILKLGKPYVHGTVMDVIRVPEKYSVALRVAIGSHINDIIVDSVENSVELIKFLKKEQIGRARFIPLDRIAGRPINKKEDKKIIGYAIDLIEFNEKYQKVLEYVLGNTVVVENIAIAKDIIKKERMRIVTTDGDLIESSGAMLGGWYKKKAPVVDTKKYLNEIKTIELENKKLWKEIRTLKKKIKELEIKEKKEIRGTSSLEKEIAKTEKNIFSLRNKRKKLYDEKSVLENKISGLKIKRAGLEAKLSNLRMEKEEFKDIKNFYNISVDELKEGIRKVIIEINALGPVNLRAIDEYKTIDTEFGELKQKLDKLLEEKHAITKTAEEIEKKRYKKFMETLIEISKNFSRIYSDLTSGDANLRLVETEDIDSGLIIEAQPKGKKMLNIDSMSGGEKAVTALTFLFAIQQYKASPFCILDEADAALDKVNTKRIIHLIKKYSKNIQFIVITHSDITIGEADKVFGVSMENGVSKIFGIKMPKE